MHHPSIEQYLILRSMPLRQLNAAGVPVRIASGCMADAFGVRWLLTVSHAVENGGCWAVEIGFEAGKGTLLYKLGSFDSDSNSDESVAGEPDLDLAFRTLPDNVAPRWQPSNAQASQVHDLPREVVRLSPDGPTSSGKYGFAGNVMPSRENHGGIHYFATEQVAYHGLRYSGEEGNYHLFQLPIEHPGHEFFEGTSGAPILDSSGQAVALVCGPGAPPNTIRAVGVHHALPRLKRSVSKLQRLEGM